jgi:carbonic anhydrase/acetyltransferase-like protein (isoleucine patch superfamily)
LFSDGWHRRDVEIDYRGPHISNYAFVAPSAALSGLVEVWDYASVWSDAVVRGDVRLVRIGAYANIQVRRDGVLAGWRVLKKAGRNGDH